MFVNCEHLFPVDSEKLKYSAALFVQTIHWIIKQSESIMKSMVTGAKFSGRCPYKFLWHATNTLDFYDGKYEIGINDWELESNTLESNLNFTNPASMWEYIVYGIDLANADQNLVWDFCCAVNTVSTAFKSNWRDSFYTNQQFVVYGV